MGDKNRMQALIYENPPEDINPEVENRRSALMEEMMVLSAAIHYIHSEGSEEPNEAKRRKIQWKDKADEFISLGSQADASEIIISNELEEEIKIELKDLVLIPTERLKELRNNILNMVNVQISSIDFFDDEEIDSKISATERLYGLFFMYEKVTKHLQMKSKVEYN